MSSLDVRAIKADELNEAPAPAVKQSFRVFLAEGAFDRAVERGGTDTTREVGGVLVGEVLRDAAGPYLRIETTVDALHADEKGAELTFTHATWEHINKEMDSHHQGKRVVGWYHTHPGFGIFLSDRDQFIHRSFFNLPFQVAFVYDPKSREHGMFTWHDNEIVRTRRYWVGEREQLWDGARQAGGDMRGKVEGKSEDSRRDEPRPPREAPLVEGPGALATLIAGGVLLLLLGGFIGNWWGASSANHVIEQAQAEVAKARADAIDTVVGDLQSDLVGVLRESLGDAGMRTPIAMATHELDTTITSLEAGSGSGSAAPVNTSELASTLRGARDRLTRIADDRESAEALLTQLALRARDKTRLHEDLGHDVAEQRSGLGTLYAELAADVAKAGDKARAKRLLTIAAHLDPGNRVRYEQQLHTFDKSASLPPDTGAATGSGGMR
jgi:proteasome lid subunit RPN8/RPN11